MAILRSRQKGILIRKHSGNQRMRKSGLKNLRHLNQQKISLLETESIIIQFKIHNIKIAKKLPLFQKFRCQLSKGLILYRLTERVQLTLLQLFLFLHPFRKKKILLFTHFGSLRYYGFLPPAPRQFILSFRLFFDKIFLLKNENISWLPCFIVKKKRRYNFSFKILLFPLVFIRKNRTHSAGRAPQIPHSPLFFESLCRRL